MPVDPNARLRITADDQTRGAWASAVNTARKGADKIKDQVKDLFKGFAAGVSIAGLQKLITQALEYGDAIGKAATKSGLTTNAVSELAFAAKGSGIELAELSSALGKMQVNISKASAGSEELKEAFAEVGIRFERFRKANPERQFEALAEAINRIPDEADKARLATKVFGEAGSRLLPLFSQGAEGIRKAREEAVRLGISLGPEEQQKLQDAGDALGEMKEAATGLGRELAISLSPSITKAAKDLEDMVVVTNRLIAKFGEFYSKIEGSPKALAALEALKFAVNPIGTLGKFAGSALLSSVKEEEPSKPFLYLPPGGVAVNDLLAPPKKPGDEEFASRAEAVEYLRSQSRRREDRSISDRFDEATTSYENEAKLLAELERNLAESNERIFQENTEAISEYLDNVQSETLETLEIQRSVFEELGDTIEGSLADAFYNASTGARGFADTVLDSFKRILADRAASQVVKLFSSIFGGDKDPGVSASSSGALPSLISGALLGGFGGFKAEGGPLTQGKWYMAGEQGQEPIWGGGPGAFAVGYGQQMAMAQSSSIGSITINQPITINGDMPPARAAAFAKQVSDQTVNRVREEMRRGKLGSKR